MNKKIFYGIVTISVITIITLIGILSFSNSGKQTIIKENQINDKTEKIPNDPNATSLSGVSLEIQKLKLENSNTGKINDKIAVLFITDSSKEQLKDVKKGLFDRVKSETFLKKANFTEIDYNDKNGKIIASSILEKTGLKTVPQVLFNTGILYDAGKITDFLQNTSDKNIFRLDIGNGLEIEKKQKDNVK